MRTVAELISYLEQLPKDTIVLKEMREGGVYSFFEERYISKKEIGVKIKYNFIYAGTPDLTGKKAIVL